jgi:hypothetical protein
MAKFIKSGSRDKKNGSERRAGVKIFKFADVKRSTSAEFSNIGAIHVKFVCANVGNSILVHEKINDVWAVNKKSNCAKSGCVMKVCGTAIETQSFGILK